MEIYIVYAEGGQYEDYFEEKRIFVGSAGKETAQAVYDEFVDEWYGADRITLSYGKVNQHGEVLAGDIISETIR